MQKLLEQYNSIKPDKGWVKQTRKDLKSQIPGPNYSLYTSGLLVIFILSLGLIAYEAPPQAFKIVEQRQEQKQIAKTVQQARQTAKKIEKILTAKIESNEADEISPVVKLQEDLDEIKATGIILDGIEQDIQNGDYLIARQKLDKLLKNSNIEEPKLKVEGSIEIEKIK